MTTTTLPVSKKRVTIVPIDTDVDADNNQPKDNIIQWAINEIRQYQDRMSIDGRKIQEIADKLEKLL